MCYHPVESKLFRIPTTSTNTSRHRWLPGHWLEQRCCIGGGCKAMWALWSFPSRVDVNTASEHRETDKLMFFGQPADIYSEEDCRGISVLCSQFIRSTQWSKSISPDFRTSNSLESGWDWITKEANLSFSNSLCFIPLEIFQKDEPQHALMYLYKVEHVLFLVVLLDNMTLGCLYF